MLVAGLGLLAVYWLRAARVPHPLFSPSLFSTPTFAAGILGNLFARLGSGALPFLTPLLLQLALGYSPAQAGMSMIPLALGAMAAKPLAKPLIDRFGYRRVLTINTLLLGSLIAIVAVFLILPDWQGRRLDRLLASTLTSHAEYLREILAQYVSGKRDDLAYRVARRNAHNADAALTTTLSNMLMEPGHFRRDTEQGFRFLVVTHTLLGYLSPLGAHRAPLGTDQDATLLEEAGARIVAALEEIAGGLTANSVLAVHNEEEQALAENGISCQSPQWIASSTP